MEIHITQEEKQYKTEINKQQELIRKLNEEISILNLKLKEKDNEIRINELKVKELNKISKHNEISTSNKNNVIIQKRCTSANINIRQDNFMNYPQNDTINNANNTHQSEKSSLNEKKSDNQHKFKNNYNAAILFSLENNYCSSTTNNYE